MVMKKIRLTQAQSETREYPDLDVDHVYTIIGIEADDYRIVNLGGRPFLYPATHFEVLDATEPEDWVTESGEDGEKYAYPPQLGAPGFFEDYLEGQPEPAAAFDEYLKARLS